MIQVLLAVQDQEFKDLLKGVCCYAGCRVLTADNPEEVMDMLRNEKINIIFFDLSSLYSASIELLSTINENSRKRAFILISEQAGHIEEINLSTENIFYNIVKPLNPDEIEQVISAAIETASKEMDEKESYVEGKAVTGDALKKIPNGKRQKKACKNAFLYVIRGIPDIDRKITLRIRGLHLRNFPNPFSLIAKPAKSLDWLMIKFTHKII